MLFSLLLTISALCVVSCTPQALQAPIKCAKLCTRREIRDLSPPERTRLFEAMKKMNSGARPTAWDRYTQIHLQGQNIFHGCAMFLPWHRMMLRRVEQELQRVDPGVAMAYWDWTLDSNQPERSVIFTAAFIGGDSQGACLKDGPFAGMQVQYPTPHCVARRFRATGVGPFTHGAVLDSIIGQSQAFDDFRQLVESVPHAIPHIGIGGDLAEMQSPNDPVFYLHHAFIDKLWFDWQQMDRSREAAYNGVNRNGQRATINDQLPSLNAQVKDALSTQTLCYTYATTRANRLQRRGVGAKARIQKKAAGKAADKAPKTTAVTLRMPILKLEDAQCVAGKMKEEIIIPKPIPQSWVKMNGYCEETIRSMEESFKCITDLVNVEYRKLHPKQEEPDGAY